MTRIVLLLCCLLSALPARGQTLDAEFQRIAAEVSVLLLGEPRPGGNRLDVHMLPVVDDETGEPCRALSATLRQRMGAKVKQALGTNRHIVRVISRQTAAEGEIAMRLTWTMRLGKLEIRPAYGRMDGGNIANEIFSHATVSLDSLSRRERKCLPEISQPPQTSAPIPAAPAVVAPPPDPNAEAERQLGLSRDDRRKIQRTLRADGHYRAGIDGLFGAGSRRAISGWQLANGYDATGYLNRRQAETLIARAPAPPPSVPRVTECDRLAGRPDDLQGTTRGVPWRSLDGAALRACERDVARYPGVPRLLFQLGRAQEKLDRNADALSNYRRAVEAGHAAAMTGLGWMYEIGRGVAQDEREAVRWFRKAAAAGDPPGMNALGMMYEFGRGGLEKSRAKAIEWYRKAADAGNEYARDNLDRLGVD